MRVTRPRATKASQITWDVAATLVASLENGGVNEISVADLSGALADTQIPSAHKTTHQNGGADELSVAGLSGLAGDAQTPLSHDHTKHTNRTRTIPMGLINISGTMGLRYGIPQAALDSAGERVGGFCKIPGDYVSTPKIYLGYLQGGAGDVIVDILANWKISGEEVAATDETITDKTWAAGTLNYLYIRDLGLAFSGLAGGDWLFVVVEQSTGSNIDVAGLIFEYTADM